MRARSLVPGIITVVSSVLFVASDASGQPSPLFLRCTGTQTIESNHSATETSAKTFYYVVDFSALVFGYASSDDKVWMRDGWCQAPSVSGAAIKVSCNAGTGGSHIESYEIDRVAGTARHLTFLTGRGGVIIFEFKGQCDKLDRDPFNVAGKF